MAAEIFSAKTIFLANSGEDEFVAPGEGAGVPLGTYDRVYAALVRWGRYKVVNSPAQADLLLEVRSRMAENAQGQALFEARRIEYRLVERRSQTTLWGGSIHMERAARQRTLERNLNDAIEFLMRDLKQVVDRAATAPV